MTRYGIKWLREIPNELLYIPICSFLINNPYTDFYIACPTIASKKLFIGFLNRLFSSENNPFLKRLHVITAEEAEEEDIEFFPPNYIFIESIINKNTLKIDNIFFSSEQPLSVYLKQIVYSIEENGAGILEFPGNQWDNFISAWNIKTPCNYYWKKYVVPFMNLQQIDIPCFSFCLYGNLSKYIQGFLKNIPLVRTFFPNYAISLWVRADVLTYKNVSVFVDELAKNNFILKNFLIFEIQDPDHICMMRYRMYLANHWYPTEIYSRDTDSRVNSREVSCIEDFQASDKKFHIIRDHFWHKSKIMGGTCGLKIKSNNIPFFPELFDTWSKKNIIQDYATDEKFLQDIVYPYFNHTILVQSNMVVYADEDSIPIRHIINNEGTDFIGNCYDCNDNPQFRYLDFPYEQHFNWLLKQCGGKGGAERILLDMIAHPIVHNHLLRNKDILSKLVGVAINSGNFEQAKQLFAEFEWIPTVDEGTLHTLVIPFYRGLCENDEVRLVITTDVQRKAKDTNEEIICIGDFPYGVWNLPGKTNRICLPLIFYRLFTNIEDKFFTDKITWEYDPCWEKIRRIYVLNLEERVDRWVATLGELARMAAPMNRIFHYKAKKADISAKLEIYWGATKNHVDCVKDFIDNGEECCLILEDDFQFCSDIKANQQRLLKFFSRNYDYDICMISYSKIGPIEPKDDLVLLSKQSCTTSSGYILCKKTAGKIYGVLEEGLRRMRDTGDYSTYCCDRYWSKIQGDGKFFLLRDKIGFQRVVYSNITGCNNLYLD